MVSAAGYEVAALGVQAWASFILAGFAVLVLVINSNLEGSGWLRKVHWAMLVFAGVELVLFLVYWFAPLRIGEIMMVNGFCIGVMVRVVVDAIGRRGRVVE